jgi:hypothetical protein
VAALLAELGEARGSDRRLDSYLDLVEGELCDLMARRREDARLRS